MKKILLIIFLICFVGGKGYAYTWTVAGNNTNLFGGLLTWLQTRSENDMIQYGSSSTYYLAKEFTTTSTTTVEFQVYRNHASVYHYGFNGGNDNASFTVTAGTYNIVFVFNEDTKFLDVIQMANVQGLAANGFDSDWSVDKTVDRMTYDDSDHKFHLKKPVVTTTNNETLDYKIVTRHKDDSDPTLGRIIYSPASAYVVPNAGNYVADFTFDPVTKEVGIASLLRYMDVTVTAEANFATFSCPFNTIVPDDVTAHYITSRDGATVNLNTEYADKIPATTTTPQRGSGVILEGTGTYRFTETTEAIASDYLTGNLLHGTGDNTYAVAAGDTYVFANGANNVGFYLAVAGTYAKYKAFLLASDIGAVAPVREFYGIDFGNEETAISQIVSPQHNGTYYNLMGQPVAHPTKGVYIVNGRKILIK